MNPKTAEKSQKQYCNRPKILIQFCGRAPSSSWGVLVRASAECFGIIYFFIFIFLNGTKPRLTFRPTWRPAGRNCQHFHLEDDKKI